MNSKTRSDIIGAIAQLAGSLTLKPESGVQGPNITHLVTLNDSLYSGIVFNELQIRR